VTVDDAARLAAIARLEAALAAKDAEIRRTEEAAAHLAAEWVLAKYARCTTLN
jgi:hypothetical protein